MVTTHIIHKKYRGLILLVFKIRDIFKTGKPKQETSKSHLQVTQTTLASMSEYLIDKRFDKFTSTNLKEVRKHPSVRAAAKILSYATVREGSFTNITHPERARIIEHLFKTSEESYKMFLSRMMIEGIFWG